MFWDGLPQQFTFSSESLRDMTLLVYCYLRFSGLDWDLEPPGSISSGWACYVSGSLSGSSSVPTRFLHFRRAFVCLKCGGVMCRYLGIP